MQADLDPRGLAAPERWILSRLSRLAAEVGERFGAFRFDEACNKLYHFFWGDLCDWYIELAKPALSGEAPRPRAGEVLLTVLDRSLRLLHPVMPFLTEEVWQRLPGHEAIHPTTICLAPYPGREERWESGEVEDQMELLQQVVTRVRAWRAELGLPAKARLALYLDPREAGARAGLLAEHPHLVRALCRVESVTVAPPPAGGEDLARDLVGGVEVALAAVSVARAAGSPAGPAGSLAVVERERLQKELAKLGGEIERAERRLADEDFLAKAPAAVVTRGRARLAELRERRERIRAQLGGG